MPADGGYQQIPADGGGGMMGMMGMRPAGMAGGNDVHMSVAAGIGVGRGHVVAEYQTGPSKVTDTYTVVGNGKPTDERLVGNGNPEEPKNKCCLYVCFGVVALIVLNFMAATAVSDVHVTVIGHHWMFKIHTEVFTVVHDGDWQTRIPYDSYNRMCSVRQSGTSRRIIGQNCYNRETTRSSTSCSTSNGVQHCQTVTTPVVQQICHNIYQYYVNYDTWCDYWVNRWVHQPTAVSSGIGLAPYWPYAPVTNCGMLGCTRLNPTHPTSQHFMVDFNINDGHSAGPRDTCDFSDPGMWGWLIDGSEYQAQATQFGRKLICNSFQTPQAAPPPPNYTFVPDGGNSTDVLPLAPAHMTTPAPGPEYAPGGQFTGSVPGPAPAPPPFFLAAEEPEIIELDAAGLAGMAQGDATE